jgi:glycosyltransferase involved in cell wall biosynthesis
MYGSDKVLFFLVRGLRERGVFHPLVVLPEPGPLHAALVAAGVEVHIGEVGKVSRSVFSPKGLLQLVSAIFRSMRDVDTIVAGRKVIVVHSNTLAVLGGAVWALRRRVAHLWHVHEIILSPRVVSRAFPLLARALADRVMSNSTLTEKWLLAEQPKLSGRSAVVFNGLPVTLPPPEAEVRAFRQRVGAAAGDVVVTLAGRLNRWKGHGLLIDAAALLKRRGSLGRLRFAIVGDTAPGQEDLRDQLLERVRTAGLEDRFSFVAFVDDINPVWFGSDIAVVPSIDPEPFGMVAIEAMAASVPVIAAGHGGLLDIVVGDRTGILFEPRNSASLADALARLADDPVARKRLGECGAIRQAALFSVHRQIERTEAIYQEMQKVS